MNLEELRFAVLDSLSRLQQSHPDPGGRKVAMALKEVLMEEDETLNRVLARIRLMDNWRKAS